MCWGGLMAKALEEIQEFYKKSLKNLSEKRQRQILNGLIYLGLFFPFFEHGKIGYFYLNEFEFFALPFFLLMLIWLAEGNKNELGIVDSILNKGYFVSGIGFLLAYCYLFLQQGKLDEKAWLFRSENSLSIKQSLEVASFGFLFSFSFALFFFFYHSYNLFFKGSSFQKHPNQTYHSMMGLIFTFYLFSLFLPMYDGNNIIPDNCSLWQIFLCLPFIPFLLLLIFYCYLKEEINPYKNYAPIYFSCYLILTWALCLSGLHTHSDWISSYEILFVKATNWSYLFWKKFVGFYLSLGFSLLGLIVSFFYWFKRSNFKNPQS